jgi:arylsulfatase A-like enzyme
MNYFDAHEPYLPPPPFDRRFGPGRARGRYSPLHHWLWNPAVAYGEMRPAELREEMDAYDNSLTFLDAQLGQLFDALSARQLLERTLVVITADHGEEFGEHAVLEHGYSLYKNAVHVPLIVVFPERIPSTRRIAEVVSLRDVPATIVGILEGAAAAPFPGASLAPLWDHSDPSSQDHPVRESAVMSELQRPPGEQPSWFPVSKGDMQALFDRGLRYVRNGDGAEELYDFFRDPAERHNLVSEAAYQTRLEGFRRMLKSQHHSFPAKRGL